MTLREKILQALTEKHNATNGSCGTYIAPFYAMFEEDSSEVKKELSALYLEGKISTRKGVNGSMIFLKIIKPCTT